MNGTVNNVTVNNVTDGDLESNSSIPMNGTADNVTDTVNSSMTTIPGLINQTKTAIVNYTFMCYNESQNQNNFNSDKNSFNRGQNSWNQNQNDWNWNKNNQKIEEISSDLNIKIMILPMILILIIVGCCKLVCVFKSGSKNVNYDQGQPSNFDSPVQPGFVVTPTNQPTAPMDAYLNGIISDAPPSYEKSVETTLF